MPEYKFTARQQSGQMQKGTLTAHDRPAAIAALRAKQLTPIVIKESKTNTGLSMNITLPGLDGVKTKDLVIFTREFSTMISAGVPILRSLNILKEQSESYVLRKALEEVTNDVQGGSNLSTALAKHPKAFSQLYVNMVKAGETGGILDEVLKRLAFQEEKDAAVKGKIKAAMIYPSVVFFVTIIAFFILMTFIVPKIGAILTSLSEGKGKLPIYTRALLAISHVMTKPAFIFPIVVGVPIVALLFRRYIKTEKGRYRWHMVILQIPVVNVIITKASIARFSRIFSSLMGSGVSIVEAINTTAAAIGNAVIEKELLDCAKAVEAGGELSDELKKSQHFPPIVAQMLAVGEETGKTDEIILKIAEFYEEEVDTAVGALSSIIEPVMIILLGGMVGIIAISVFAPIAQLSTNVGG
jgi:type IV pilus assembly protein PilC